MSVAEPPELSPEDEMLRPTILTDKYQSVETSFRRSAISDQLFAERRLLDMNNYIRRISPDNIVLTVTISSRRASYASDDR